MTTAYTSLLGLALPVTGELSGTWGDVVNTSITSLVDSAVAGTTTLSSDADVTLTTTTGAANTAREAVLLWTASGTVTRNITAPAQSKVYIVINATGSTQSIVLRGVGPTTGVTIVAAEKALCAWNGTDFVKISTTATASSFSAGTTGFTPSSATTGAITLAGTLATANGGTNLTTFTAANNAIYSTSASVLTAGTLPIAAGGTGATTLAGANIALTNTAQTFTATQTFNGTSATEALKPLNIAEPASVSGTAPTATTNFYINSGAVQYITANNANNWTLNFAFSSGTTLNTAMATNDSISCTLIVTNTTTAYYASAFTIDGTSVTPKWQGGTAPTSGNASSIDSYTFVIIKTAASTYTVLASQTKFA